MIVRDGERGAALLAVLLLVAVIGALAATMLGKMRLQTALALNNQAAAQARAFGLGLESLVTLTIDDLTAASRERTTLQGGWNGAVRRYPLPGGRGLAEVRVSDGGNCFNINSVAQGDPLIGLAARPLGIRQFAGLMQLLGVQQAEAARIAAASADWVDSDADPVWGGAEDQAYAGTNQPYRTGNTLFAEVSELRAVAGMTPDIYARLRPYLCALPVAEMSPINVNTLLPNQAPLVAMLDPQRIGIDKARRIIVERPAAGWESQVAFWNQPILKDGTSPEVALQPQVRTQWFAVDMQIAIEDAELTETALVDARVQPARIAQRRWGADD